jgi:hypothetical protein
MDDVSICTGYVAHQRSTCVMMTCQHDDVAAPEAATCHPFLAFFGRYVDQWKSAMWQSIQPHGRPYRTWQTRGIRTTTWQVMWQADQAGGDVAVTV